MEKQWKVSDFILGGSKITADGDWSHEIKRHLLLGRKVMTNLDSILKSRDITLSTKVCLVKAMVFPVVMYRCESWTIKKAEDQRIDAFELCCCRRLLRVPWTARRSNQFSSVQSLSRVWLFATPWIAARQASLSITISRSSLRLMSIESVMPSVISSSVVPFSSCLQSLPASKSFPMSQLFAGGGQSIGVSVLASVLPKNT